MLNASAQASQPLLPCAPNPDQDERDDRPLIFPGHLLVSPSTDNVPDKGFVWKKSMLFRKSRTAEAQQLAGKDMIMIEPVGETSLPTSTSIEMSGTVKGAAKWQQIGHDVASKLLQSLTAACLEWLLLTPNPSTCKPRMAWSCPQRWAWISWT